MRTPSFPCLLAATLAALLLAAPVPARAMDAHALYEKIRGSVVMVYRMFNDNTPNCLGSGFAVGDGTLVVTNQHVVGSSSANVALKTSDGKILRDIRVLRVSLENDLAVLKLPVALPPLELCSDGALVGREVAALGNPEGYMGTLSTGVVSGIRKYPNWRVQELVQTTVPISPGSSGSPLLDNQGRVVGVICSGYDDGQNLNFAVPVEKLRKLLGRDLTSAGGDAPTTPPPQSSGSLEVRQGADGAITIIQQRPKK